MPVERLTLDSRLQIRYQIGEVDGEPVYRLRTVATVRADSEDADLWALATAIGSLQTWQIAEVRRVDSAELYQI